MGRNKEREALLAALSNHIVVHDKACAELSMAVAILTRELDEVKSANAEVRVQLALTEVALAVALGRLAGELGLSEGQWEALRAEVYQQALLDLEGQND